MAASPSHSNLSALPRELHGPILRGLRWTLWLSAVAMPLGYATRLMLARTGPQVIGAFGLLLIYVRLVSTFLLLGGNAVLIQFLPRLPPRRRRAFLVQYGAIVLAALVPWFAVAWLWPQGLRWLFGPVGGARFQVILIWLSPIYIALSLSTAALKGLLEIAPAQMLGRAVTIGSFVIYAALFFTARGVLAREYLFLVWGIYLTLAAVMASIGLWLFWRATRTSPRGAGRRWRPLRFLRSYPLPAGFWRYTLSLQGNSTIGFLSASLDSLLVLHWGGLRQLGLYVALMTLVTIIPTLLDILLDTLLPSLTHALAQGGYPAVASLNEATSQVLLLAALVMSVFLALFARPMVAIFGPVYQGLAPMLRIAAPAAAILAASHLYNTIFSAIGQPQRSTVAQIFRLIVFVALFPGLWRTQGLAGAVWAWAASELAHHLASVYFVRRGGLHLPFPRGYAAFWLGLALGSGLALAAPRMPLALDAAAWLAIVTGFFVAAGYAPAQIRDFLRLLLPGATPRAA
jgi:O-antigen/teichoic acid export membrane protein